MGKWEKFPWKYEERERLFRSVVYASESIKGPHVKWSK